MDNTARDIEIASAGQNPNILTALSGAPTESSQMRAPVQQDIAEAKDIATGASKAFYGGSNFVPQVEAEREAKLQELFGYDKSLEMGYSPYPKKEGYVENPADLYSAGAGYARTTGGIISALGGMQDATESAYQTATTSIMNKLIDLLTLNEQRKKAEEDAKFAREKFEYEKEQDKKQLALEYARLARTGPGTSAAEISKAALMADLEQKVKMGVTPKDLFAIYGPKGLEMVDIMNVYNAPGLSPHGPAKESWEELQQMYLTQNLGKPKSPAPTSLADEIQAKATGGEREKAEVVADMWIAAKKAREIAETASTGPLTGFRVGTIDKLFGIQSDTKELDKYLGELVNAIRKDTTGVAFSPKEQEAIVDRVGSIMRQEGDVKGGLDYVLDRVETKLGLKGIDFSKYDYNTGLLLGEAGSSGESGWENQPMLISPDGVLFYYEGENDPDYIEDLNNGFKRF